MTNAKDYKNLTQEQLVKELDFLSSRISENERKLRAIFDQTYQFIGLMTPDGILIEANRSALEFSGVDAAAVLNKPFWLTPWWTHSAVLQDKLKKGIKDAVGGKFVRFEATHIAKDGSLHYIDFSLKPVKDDSGKVIYLIPEGRDITERQEMDERLKEAQSELEIRVKVRTAELTKANEELHREIAQRKRIEELLKESESRFRAIVEDQTELICRFLPDATITFINDAYARYFGKKRNELLGKKFMPLIPPDDRKKVEANIKSLSADNPVVTHEHRVYAADGVLRWQQWTNRAILNNDGAVTEFQAVGRDITDQKKAEEQLKLNERFLSSVFSSIQDGLSILDKEMNILRVNSTMEKWYAHNMPVVGKKCFEAYHCRNLPCKICPTRQTLNQGKAAMEVVPKRGPEGKINGWLEVYSFPLLDQETGELKGAIEYVRDISDRMRVEEERERLTRELAKSNRRLKQIALMDPLTGVYNRRYLDKVIEAEFHRAKRYVHPLAVIMIDLDYFKSVNEVYGFKFGDAVLKQFARQLRHDIRKYDILIRFGGEEFIILSPGIARPEALALAQRLLETLSIYNFGDKRQKVKLKMSLSVTSFPEDRIAKGMDLINLADKLISKAKESGGSKVYSSLEVKREKPQDMKKVDIKMLKGRLVRLTKKANQNLVEAIFAFAKTIELKDHYTGEHVENTVRYATEIAKALSLPAEEIELVKQASMLHDLGKVGVSENILLKKSKLNKKEFDEIKRHPQIGADIIRPIQYLRDIIPFIFYHHERWDGHGYPSGIKGEEIPMGARIIALADVYQALTSDRPYRKAYSKKKAIQIIKEGSGTQFDPKIVDIFLKILEKKKR